MYFSLPTGFVSWSSVNSGGSVVIGPKADHIIEDEEKGIDETGRKDVCEGPALLYIKLIEFDSWLDEPSASITSIWGGIDDTREALLDSKDDELGGLENAACDGKAKEVAVSAIFGMLVDV